MTIDPRTPTRPGRSTSGFFTERADIVCTKREASGVGGKGWGVGGIYQAIFASYIKETLWFGVYAHVEDCVARKM